MSRARLFLVLTLVLFLGWLAWLGYAVVVARFSGDPPVVISRAQLTAATHLVVAEVTLDAEGLPETEAVVVEVLRGEDLAPGSAIRIRDLASALPPGSRGFPGPGRYLVPVVREGTTYRVAGLPRSPGFEPATLPRPAVYRWDESTRAQLQGLGIVGR